MNRKTFLATIAALFTAPFVKSKEKEKVLVKNQTDRKYNGIYEPGEPLTIPEADRRWLNQGNCEEWIRYSKGDVVITSRKVYREGRLVDDQMVYDAESDKNPGIRDKWAERLAKQQQDIPPDIAKVVNKKFWDMI